MNSWKWHHRWQGQWRQHMAHWPPLVRELPTRVGTLCCSCPLPLCRKGRIKVQRLQRRYMQTLTWESWLLRVSWHNSAPMTWTRAQVIKKLIYSQKHRRPRSDIWGIYKITKGINQVNVRSFPPREGKSKTRGIGLRQEGKDLTETRGATLYLVAGGYMERAARGSGDRQESNNLKDIWTVHSEGYGLSVGNWTSWSAWTNWANGPSSALFCYYNFSPPNNGLVIAIPSPADSSVDLKKN